MVDHPNIVKLFEFFEDDKNLYLICEYCKGGQLFEKLMEQQTFSENEAAHIMLQLLSAITHCHDRKIVHRDIKPENLLVDPNENDSTKYDIKVIDFGVSCKFDPDKVLTLAIGTVSSSYELIYLALLCCTRGYPEDV